MSQFTVLDAADSVQYERWIGIWESWEGKEAFAHPVYAETLKRPCDSAICIVHEDSGGMVFLPLIARPLSAETWAGSNNTLQDIVTPYGFGGPFAIGTPDIGEFWQNLTQWARREGIITAFFRLSPFSVDIKEFLTEVEVKGGNVVRSLTAGKEKIWQEFNKTVRHHIRRAERLGLTVEIDPDGERIDEFLGLYSQTMHRRKALAFYHFPEQFYYDIFHNIPGRSMLFHVISDNHAISSEMVLLGKENMYAFLGGNDERFSHMKPGELLAGGIIDWGIDHGMKRYILGGGYDGYDSIFQFKKKFAPYGIVPFEVGKHIFDSTAYFDMCQKRMDFDIDQGKGGEGDSSYFPSYRSKYD